MIKGIFSRIKPKTKRRLKRAGITSFILLSIAIISGIFFGYYYEDTVKSIIIEQLNKRLNTEIQVKEIEFSVFKKFPYASVDFYDAVAKDAIPGDTKNKGNLLEAKHVYLQLSLIDLIFGKYRVKKIELADARVNIRVFKNHSDNFNFWKPASDSASGDFSFDLQKLILLNVAVSYVNESNRQDDLYHTRELILKGRFSDEDFTLNADGQIYIYRIKSGKEVFLAHKNSLVDLTLHVKNSTNEYSFEEGDIYMGGLRFGVTGMMTFSDSVKTADITIKGRELDLEDFIEELPSGYKSYFEGYDCDGEFVFTATIKGRFDGKNTPRFDAAFGISEGSFFNRKNDIKLTSVSFNGIYSNGNSQSKSTSSLLIDRFSSELNGGTLGGSFKISDFTNPSLDIKLNASLNLADVFRFIDADTVESASGNIRVDAAYKGKLSKEGRFTMGHFVVSESSGEMIFENCDIILKGNSPSLKNINGKFRFTNNDIETDGLTGIFGNSDFALNGSFRNLIPFLFVERQRLVIKASLKSARFDLDDMLRYSYTSKDTTYRLDIPDYLDFDIDMNLGNFSFRKFRASSVTGNIVLKNRQILAKNIACAAMNGKTTGTLLIDGSGGGKLLISCEANVSKVDISSMFYQFGNFGQQSMKHDNIHGLLTANITFASVWSNSLECDLQTVYAKTELTIEKGELVNYAPLSGLSPHLKGRDLTHVKFATLTNTIEIKDQVISIPAMKIHSDAIDFDVYGTHSFKNEIDYHLGVVIADLKNANGKQQENEFGVIEDDGLHKEKYFFRITGTVENPVYHTIDKEGYKQNILKNIEQEKENLKDILKREFGWFKKDTVKGKDNKGNGEKKENNNFEFEIEWDEDGSGGE